jgi:DNA-binding CsgD family transcriptional regulator
MIQWLAPKYDRNQINKLYTKLDVNGSGLVDKK